MYEIDYDIYITVIILNIRFNKKKGIIKIIFIVLIYQNQSVQCFYCAYERSNVFDKTFNFWHLLEEDVLIL